MFKRVVLATDLSDAWEELVAGAGELRVLGAEELILAHVLAVTPLGGLEERRRVEAEPRLAEQRAALEGQGFRVTVELQSGLPASVLWEVAQKHAADLVVLGPPKPSRWQERILGSVTSAVLHQAEIPVLLLKPALAEGREGEGLRLSARELLRHVLFPTDFSSISDRAGAFLEGLAGRGLARVTLLNALDVPGGEEYPPGFQERALAQAQEALEDWQQRLLKAGIPTVEAILDPGHPVPAILKVLKRENISLIVMGTQGKGFIKELFLGSVSHNIARLAPCPVLLIPPASR